jgi:hypothetical protein
MPKVGRERPRIDPLVDQLEAGGMAQQVRMDACHADAFGRPCEGLEEAVRGEGRAPLGDEDKARPRLLLPAQLPKCLDLDPALPQLAFAVLSGDLVLTFRTMVSHGFVSFQTVASVAS